MCAKLSEMQGWVFRDLIIWLLAYRYTELYQGVNGETEFHCIWFLYKGYCSVLIVEEKVINILGCVCTWPAPTLMKYILG